LKNEWIRRRVGRRADGEIVMRSISIAKIAASGSVLVGAGGVALVFGVANMQHEKPLETVTVTSATSPSPPAPLVKSESSPALAATAAEVAAFAAELAGPSSRPATDESVPSFDVARTEGTGDAVIAGRAPPGAIVDLVREGERLDRAVADASGQFVMVPSRLPAGSYELTLNAKMPDGTVASSKQGVMITVIDAGANSGAAQLRAEHVPEITSRVDPPPRPPSRAAKLQENAALQPAMAVGSASDKGASSPVTAPRILNRVVSRGDSLWRISRIAYGDVHDTRLCTGQTETGSGIQISFIPARSF
jgi:nucleoid-associated protein YgaU